MTSSHKLRNNIAAAPGRDIVSFNGGTDTFNSWTLPVEVTAADFVSMDKAQGLLPRNADGSLPSATFVRLADGSDLIDRGEDVGLPFGGSAPDLGAYEWGDTPPVQPMDGGMPDAAVGADAGVPSAGSGASAGAGGSQTPPSVVPPPSGGSSAGRMAAPPSAGTTATPPGMAAAGSAAPAPSAPGASTAEGEGCGCRIGAPRRSVTGAWLALAAGALWTARRRRRHARREG